MISRPLTETIFQIPLAWSHVYALTDPGTRETTLVDTGLQKDRSRLLEALTEIGVPVEAVTRVLLTHGHCDHAGSAAFFADRGAEIVAHRRELPFLLVPRRTYAPSGLRRLIRPISSTLFLLGESRFPVPRLNRVMDCGEGQTFSTPAGTLEAIHTPGHTPGHTAYLDRTTGILFSGDAILNIVPVRLSTAPSLPMRVFTENWGEAKRSAKRLVSLSPRWLLSGHGVPLQRETTEVLRRWAQTF